MATIAAGHERYKIIEVFVSSLTGEESRERKPLETHVEFRPPRDAVHVTNQHLGTKFARHPACKSAGYLSA